MKLKPQIVPEKLRHLIPLAEKWGVTDDAVREQMLRNASQSEVDALMRAVRAADDDLDDWLAGDESTTPTPSDEYIAFTALRMAVDFMRAAREKRP